MCKLSDYDYEIPKDLIAQFPLKERDQSRLLVFNRKSKTIEHKKFYQIVDYLKKGDMLVFNNTKVLPVRLTGRKKSGGIVEVLLLIEKKTYEWEALLKASTKPKHGDKIEFGESAMFGTVVDTHGEGKVTILFTSSNGQFKESKEFWETLDRLGIMPLPPYIKRDKNDNSNNAEDKQRYQTVFAAKKGAIAAPTAGLHFTEHLLEKIKDKGVELAFVTLHVGIGTFKPIKVDDCKDHVMHSEYYEVSEKNANSINRARLDGRRIIAVGTTSCRVLETLGDHKTTKPCSGWTNIYIIPPYKFKVTDTLITNFHQPKTTLLLLVSAFAGKENIKNTYEIAINKGYRFYSYGDSMMIV